MTVYIDTNIFVYALQDTDELGDNARKFLQMIEDGTLEGATSSITFSELVFAIMKNDSREKALEGGENFLALNNIYIEDTTKATCRIAVEAIAQYSLKPQDALHYATMKEVGITQIITEDKDFDKALDIKKFTIKEFLNR